MKSESATSTGGNVRHGRSRLRLVLVAAIATMSISVGSGVAQADFGRHHHRSADVTFTKWVTTLPADPSTFAGIDMVGVVGGDVGRGRYAGQVLGDDTVSMPGFWLGHARYGFYGHKHFFIADMHITENDGVVPITATLEGVVVKGWLKGARVTGEYTAFDTCPIPTPGNVFGTTCYQGTLHLEGPALALMRGEGRRQSARRPSRFGVQPGNGAPFSVNAGAA